MQKTSNELRPQIEEMLKNITDAFGTKVVLKNCPRVCVDTIEQVIRSFPPTWNFELTRLQYSAIPSSNDKDFKRGIFIMGIHDFGALSFLVCETKIVPNPLSTNNTPIYLTAA